MENQKTNARALRRHHAARVKAARRDYWGQMQKTPHQLGMLAHTPAMCSCFACGNPRRHFGERSIAEVRDAQHGLDELLEDSVAN